MKTPTRSKPTILLLALFAVACSSTPAPLAKRKSTRQPQSEQVAQEEASPAAELFLEMAQIGNLPGQQRMGYVPESSDKPLRGCVLFLQGLGDSMRNHSPYFSALSSAGYRVISFDYLGQGGSEGSMNSMRVQAQIPGHPTKAMIRNYEEVDKFFEISTQADFVWNRYRALKNARGEDCSSSKKLVIGWSTGGLAAYRMASESAANAVVLIAPGIHPNLMVGEAAKRWDKMLFFRETITERSLTSNSFESGENPHLDPIKPASPARVPQFSGNLLGVASQARFWRIPSSVAGLVFLSGKEDTYVDREATEKTIAAYAPHFSVKSYEGALHEIDNEVPVISIDMYDRTVAFLNSVTADQ